MWRRREHCRQETGALRIRLKSKESKTNDLCQRDRDPTRRPKSQFLRHIAPSTKNPMSIDKMRKSYQLSGLHEHEVHPNPIQQFHTWFDQAKDGEVPSWLEINAMTLSTAGCDGHVTSRIVLLKGVESDRFIFFTNYESSKGQQIANNASVALCFFWPHVERQIRICGRAEKSSREASIEYFHSRPRGSQLGAHVSEQSAIITGRSALEQTLENLEAQYADQEIPCPGHWGGYYVTPSEIEFWQGRDNRLHDRIVYRRNQEQWTIARLAP